MIDKTLKERVERYHENQTKRGMRQIRIWLPEDEVEVFQEKARKARKRFIRKMDKAEREAEN